MTCSVFIRISCAKCTSTHDRITQGMTCRLEERSGADKKPLRGKGLVSMQGRALDAHDIVSRVHVDDLAGDGAGMLLA